MSEFKIPEDDLDYLWEQMEELNFFKNPDNLGKLIVITVSEFDIPELGDWQFQLSLTPNNESDFEKRTGIKYEPLTFPEENEIIVAVYTESWDFVTDFTLEKTQMQLVCKECGLEYYYDEMEKVKDNEFIRICEDCI